MMLDGTPRNLELTHPLHLLLDPKLILRTILVYPDRWTLLKLVVVPTEIIIIRHIDVALKSIILLEYLKTSVFTPWSVRVKARTYKYNYIELDMSGTECSETKCWALKRWTVGVETKNVILSMTDQMENGKVSAHLTCGAISLCFSDYIINIL